MRDWRELSPSRIQSGVEDGKRIILEFAQDYRAVFNKELCIGCTGSFENQLQKFLKKQYMKENKTGFKLHERYNGLKLGGFRGIETITNYAMTEEKALLFLTKHPKGKGLFSLLPKNVDELIKDYKEKQEAKALEGLAPVKKEKRKKNATEEEEAKAEVKENIASAQGV
jgi:hypothetical protein